MQKKVMALAIAGLFAAPAMAQTSNVTLYGRANVGVDNYAATGATAGSNADYKSRTRVFDGSSRVGVRGVEDLGGGLRAIFQIETGVNVDTNANLGQGGQVNGSSGFWGSRDSFAGLEGGFGRLTFGRQSVWWVHGTIMQTGANYINTDVPFMNMASMGRIGVGIARQNNVTLYTTPTFGGFNASLYWSPTTGGSNQAATGGAGALVGGTDNETAGPNRKTDARLWGTTLRWSGGPVSLQGDYVDSRAASDLFTGAAGNPVNVAYRPANKAWKVLGGFRYMPGAQISAIYGRLKAEDNGAFGTQTDDITQAMWGLSWEHAFGPVQALAQYAQLRKASGCTIANACDNTQARSWLVGARYNMSKRTAVYVSYNKTTNQANQTVDYTAGGITSANPIAAGADPRVIALGVWHQF